VQSIAGPFAAVLCSRVLRETCESLQQIYAPKKRREALRASRNFC
jgi:hypothetical protein